MFAWFFLSALYLQLVLGYSPLQVGLAFLPANLIMGAFSLGLSAKLVMRFGIRAAARRRACCSPRPGLAAVRARAGRRRASSLDVLPSMILLGLGAGMAFNPVLLAAMSDVEPRGGGPRLGRRQHLVHDGRRARPRRPREPRRLADATRLTAVRRRQARRAHRRLPRRVPRRRDLRARPPRRRRAPPAAGGCGGARRDRRGRGGRRGRVSYGTYCWSIEQTVSMFTRIQTPVSSDSNSSTGASPATSCPSWSTVTAVAPRLSGSPSA